MYLIYWKWVVAKSVARLCERKNIPFEICDDTDNIQDFSKYQAIIPSPGIPGTHRIYYTGKIIAELDFAYQFFPRHGEIIAITGTDGKSTTTHILYTLLKNLYFEKRKIYISGNFEIPFSQTVCEILDNNDNNPLVVIEISSFMSYFIGKTSLRPFSPDYTIWTNLKTDHLNWHRNLQEYFDAKRNLAEHTKKFSIIHHQVSDFAGEHSLVSFFSKFANKIEWFDKNQKTVYTPYYIEWERIFTKQLGEFLLSDTNLSGEHNALNLLSVLMVLEKMQIPREKIYKYLQEISALPHRLEKFFEKNKRIFIDDSKSTSAQSLEAALHSFWDEKNFLLIVWGSDKWDTFSHLSNDFARRVKCLACIGATKDYFIEIAQKEHIPYKATDDIFEATKWLYGNSSKNDIIILSPGCASFGLFKDYLDRANQFHKAVKML